MMEKARKRLSVNGLASHSSKFFPLAFLPHSGSLCHQILISRSLYAPGVATVVFTEPQNHTDYLGLFFSLTLNTRCTSALSGSFGCMGWRLCEVNVRHAWVWVGGAATLGAVWVPSVYGPALPTPRVEFVV